MSAVRFHWPASVDDAVALLAADEGARCLAGGATLVAMLNARLLEPSALVSLAAIAELRCCERLGDGTVRIGAMRRHRETAFETDLRDGQRVLSAAAARIANPPVRNMGTLGGSISFADPAADYPPALVAADAIVEIAGPQGRRELAAEAFFRDWYITALQPGELVTAVRLPPAPPGSIGIYDKLARVAGDFAIASVALVLTMNGGSCESIRIAIGGCGPTPVRLPAVEAALVGTHLSDAAIAEAGAALAAACDPVDDVRASAEYRRRVVPRMLARALTEACHQASRMR
ncbi:MAG: xanthine dehydrogenase family protein subunit M [Gammaproteobacteria bacterium]